MIKVAYPPYQPQIKREGNKELIFDDIRKQWIKLTPEEWVRQNFLQYLVHIKQYPAASLAVEKMIQLGELKKRFDVVVYDKNFNPWMLIECKEMNTGLNREVLDQVLRYNIALQVPYLIITNGSHCRAFKCENNAMTEITELPSFGTI